MSDAFRPFPFRVEARPVEDPDQLTQPQQATLQWLRDAFETSFRTLGETPKPGVERPGALRVDGDRSNRCLFLSGARGTGKTTCLLTFAAACEQVRRRDRSADSWSGLVPSSEACRSLLWLDIVDLDAAQESMNLLASILARLHRLIERLHGSGDRQSQRSPFPWDPSGATWRTELTRLQASVAQAWTSQALEQVRTQSSHVYAAEVMEIEATRLRLADRFDEVLEGLAQDVEAHDNPSPLFVLPIDDCDLRPVHGPNLLRMLRILSNRRLLPVILGDLDTLRWTAEVEMASHLAAGGLEVGFRMLAGAGESDRRASIRSLAQTGLQKTIPPNQRWYLPNPSLGQALQFRPLGSPEDARLEAALERWPLHPPTTPIYGPASLGQYLQPPDPLTWNPDSTFLAAQLLGQSLRDLADLHAVVSSGWYQPPLVRRSRGLLRPYEIAESRTQKPPDHRDTGGLVVDQFLAALEAAPLTADATRAGHDMVRVTDTGGFYVSLKGIRAEPVVYEFAATPNSLNEYPLVAHELHHWNLFLHPSGKPEDAANPLTGRLAAAVTTLHDLARLRVCDFEALDESRLQRPTLVHQSWIGSPAFDLAWPAPPFDTLRDAHLLAKIWNAHIRGLFQSDQPQTEVLSERLSWAWAHLYLRGVQNGLHAYHLAFDESLTKDLWSPVDWQRLASGSESLFKRASPAVRWDEFLAALAPETGFSPEGATVLLASRALRKALAADEGLRARVRSRRARALGALAPALMPSASSIPLERLSLIAPELALRAARTWAGHWKQHKRKWISGKHEWVGRVSTHLTGVLGLLEQLEGKWDRHAKTKSFKTKLESTSKALAEMAAVEPALESEDRYQVRRARRVLAPKWVFGRLRDAVTDLLQAHRHALDEPGLGLCPSLYELRVPFGLPEVDLPGMSGLIQGEPRGIANSRFYGLTLEELNEQRVDVSTADTAAESLDREAAQLAESLDAPAADDSEG